MGQVILAAIDIETTGLDVEKHEIIDFAIVPLNDDFKVSKYVYSERFDKIYNIASKKDKKYIYFDLFIKKFFNSELAFKIMDMMESSRKGNNRLVKKK